MKKVVYILLRVKLIKSYTMKKTIQIGILLLLIVTVGCQNKKKRAQKQILLQKNFLLKWLILNLMKTILFLAELDLVRGTTRFGSEIIF